jgi:hypothetical protein
MKRVASVILLIALAGCSTTGGRSSHDLFDDYTYASTGEMARNGWIMRSAPGWPGGVPGAAWEPDSFSLHDDPVLPGNRVLRMSSLTGGTGADTRQSQLCHQRKYGEGTYAARVRSRMIRSTVRTAIRSSRRSTSSVR